MQTGLLWFDDSSDRDLSTKIREAAQRYQEKFGAAPNTCYVSSRVLTGGEVWLTLSGLQERTLRVVPARNILRHHFWIGIDEHDHGLDKLPSAQIISRTDN